MISYPQPSSSTQHHWPGEDRAYSQDAEITFWMELGSICRSARLSVG